MSRLAIVAAAGLILLPSPAAAAPGSLDPTFGAGGAVSSPSGQATAVTTQPGGRIVVGGESLDTSGAHRLTVAAYSVWGGLDLSFGRSGVASAPATGLADVATAPGGGIVAAGYRERGGRRDPVVARFTAAGVVKGVTGTPVGDGDAIARALAVAADGSVFVACDAVRAGEPAIAVVRLGPGGARDASFVALPGRAVTTAGIALGPDGHLTVAGTAYEPTTGATDPLVARLLPGGSPDPHFGGGAPLLVRTGLVSVQARAMALAPGGGVVVAGSGRAPLRSEFLAVRVAADGTPDASFGDDGVAVLPVGGGDAYATAVAADPTGRVVLSGDASGSAALVRLGPDGALDPAFTAAAAALLPSADTRPAALAVDQAGRFVVAGSAFGGGHRQLTLARYAGGG